MTADFQLLLPPDELVRPRTPKQLRAWVLNRCDAIRRIPETKRPALLHHGPFKKFYEEVYPFSLFAVRRYGEEDNVVCIMNLEEHRDFDAEVRHPAGVRRVEITLARDPVEHHRMTYFLEHGRVSMSGPLSVHGRGRGRKITNAIEFVDLSELRGGHLRYIKEAATGKAGYGRYGSGYELVIAVEDWWFDVDRDRIPTAEFLQREVAPLPLCFDGVHVMGFTDRLYQSVSILR